MYGKAGSYPQCSNRPILIVLSRGNDTIRCMVTVEAGRARSDEEKHRAALSRAKALAKALDVAIEDA
jgi:hypothetical protein